MRLTGRTFHVRAGRFWVLVLAFSAFVMTAEGAEADPRSVAALPISEPIQLDGLLDEPVWQQAEVAGDFIQREPATGKEATERTEVRVVYTPRTLYVGVMAYDSDPSQLIAREMQYDGNLWRDDDVTVVFDTFDDDRNGYLFDTNSNGAQTDGMITDEGRNWNQNWNGVWDVASQRTDKGWSTEIAIPFSTVRFNPEASSWGMQVRRFIRRKNEEVYWAPIPNTVDIMRVSMYGRLTGLTGIQQGWSLNVKPYVVGTSVDKSTTLKEGEELDFGADVKWGVTRGLNLDLTVNTDFGETEVDAQQVNLTRFSLFYPEMREFFLENAGIFDFGPGTLGYASPLLKVFHSRRVGIGPNGEEIPIEWGVRLNGRAGKWNIGLLDTSMGIPDQLVNPDPTIREENLGALRLKRNIGGRSTIGIILTNREDDDGNTNRVYGADLDVKATPKLGLYSFAAASDDSAVESGDEWTAGAGATFKGPIWGWNTEVVEIGDSFRPDMGFLLRDDVRRYSGRLTYEPRPTDLGIINWHWEYQGQVLTSTDGTRETEDHRLDFFGMRFNLLNEVYFFVDRGYEQLFDDFQIVPGVFIQPGAYTFDFAGVRFKADDARRLAFEGQASIGEFYDGDKTSGNLTIRYRPSGHIQSESYWEINDVELPEGKFSTNIYREKLSVYLSPRLLSSTFIQYNDLQELMSLNFRFNWIYKPGADLFVVFNQTWNAPSLSDLTTRDRRVVVKFTYLFQR